jgi:hypothetical protein
MPMKKLIIYLLTMVSFVIISSCNLSHKHENSTLTGEELAINDIQEYEVNDVYNPLLDYDIIETSNGKEIVFGSFTSMSVEEVFFLTERELFIPDETQTYDRKQWRVDLCSETLYNSIDEPEQLYEHTNSETHYYKQGEDNVIYRKLVIHNAEDSPYSYP